MSKGNQYLFLDIDGTLSPAGQSAFSSEAVEIIKAFQADGWKLILHGTARSTHLFEAFDEFQKAGIPLWSWVDPYEPSKSVAIKAYLQAHPAEQALVIDDIRFDVPGTVFIQPDSRYGLRWVNLPPALRNTD